MTGLSAEAGGGAPPYSAMAMAQWMPPRKDTMDTPYPTCGAGYGQR
jgi:hypothetical protein